MANRLTLASSEPSCSETLESALSTSLRSRPEQKQLPAPASTTVRTASSANAFSSATYNWVSNRLLSALRLSGRFRINHAVAPPVLVAIKDGSVMRYTDKEDAEKTRLKQARCLAVPAAPPVRNYGL